MNQDEFDKWAKAEEQKERVAATEIKQSLLNLGATAGDEKPLSDFAASLEKPLKGKDGKTYVAVPSPDRLNEARWAAERQIRQEQQTQTRKKNEPSL